MRIVEKIKAKKNNNMDCAPITIGFLGDSVTQGCFDVYMQNNGDIQTFFDQEHGYHTYLRKILSTIFPSVPFNIINAGISGDNAPHALERMDRDLMCHKPDIVVVCFGLNDSGAGMDGIDKYKNALKGIFEKLKETNTEAIFMTPNMMCTEVSCHLIKEFKGTAEGVSKTQNDGIMDAYMEAARKTAKESGVTVCDCYAKWKALEAAGADITELLANKINHPSEKMNWMFAYSLAEKMLGI